MNEQDSNQLRGRDIETMGQTLFDRFAELLDDDQETAKHSILNGLLMVRSRRSDYEFIFVEKISS